MHGNDHPQGKRTVILMIVLCVLLHFIIIPLWMWSYGLADTTGIEVVNYEIEECDWDHCKKIEIINKDTYPKKNKFFSSRRSINEKFNDYGRNISVIMIK